METAGKPVHPKMPRLDREAVIQRVMEKYGYRRWEVEFAADHLLGVDYPRKAK